MQIPRQAVVEQRASSRLGTLILVESQSSVSMDLKSIVILFLENGKTGTDFEFV